jgi:hypothetical protein
VILEQALDETAIATALTRSSMHIIGPPCANSVEAWKFL